MPDFNFHFQDMRPVGQSSTVSISATSTQSTTFPNFVTHTAVCSDVDCFIEIGDNPTAVLNTSKFLSGDKQERFFPIRDGESIAVVQLSTNGTLYVTPMGR